MKLLSHLFSLVLIFLCLTALPQQVGSPFLRNYTPDEYRAEPQVWTTVQDKRGVMYFGVYGGVLEFDGTNWRMIDLPEENVVRSLDIDNDGRIYVGSHGEFGYLRPDTSGRLHYQSLIAELDSADRQFLDVWNTYAHGNIVYFSTTNALYAYYPNKKEKPFKVHKRDNIFFLMYKASGRLFVSVMNEGLFELKDGQLHPMPHNDILSKNVTWIMLPYGKDSFLFSLLRKGLMVYSPNATDSTSVLSTLPFDSASITKTNQVLLEKQLYHGALLPDSTFAVSTISGGVMLIDRKGNITRYISKEQGMKSNTVHHLYLDRQAGLWASTAFGISHIEATQPISNWGETDGLLGSIYNAIRHNGKVYANTNVGLFYLANGAFHPVKSTTGRNAKQIFTLESIHLPDAKKNVLLFSSPKGTFQVEGDKAKLISNYFSFEFYQSKQQPSRIYLDHDNQLAYIDYKDGAWIQGDTLASFKESPGAFEEDEAGNLWMIIDNKPCYFSPKEKRTIWPEFSTLDTTILFNDIEVYTEKLVFLTTKGIYSYNKGFIKENTFGKFYNEKDVVQLHSNDQQNIWIAYHTKNKNYLDRLYKVNSEWKQDTFALRRLPPFESFRLDGDSLVWILSPNKLFQYNINKSFPEVQVPPALNRVVKLGVDSTLFFGAFSQTKSSLFFPSATQPEWQIPSVQFNKNDITFEFALPQYANPQNNKFSYSLSRADEEAEWSIWTKETKKEYTNLWEGNYVFKIRGKDTYGRVSKTTEYRFQIQPPLSRTPLAYLLYIISFWLFIVLLLKLNSRRMKKENARLETIIAVRTSEIVKQKEKIQRQADFLQQANHQLSEKNEEINQQKEQIQIIVETLQEANGQITEQNQLITDSIRYAKRIQMAVLPPEDLLKEYFSDSVIFFKPRDLVSGDFFFVHEVRGYLIIAVADCTGHGVPGAFMSMLSTTLLNEIVRRTEINSSAAVLEELRIKIKAALHQTEEVSAQKDGLDIALCSINLKTKELQFSGANTPLYLIRNGEIEALPFIRNPIGIYLKERPFINKTILLQKDDVVFMSTDGYPDQFGGRKGMKLKYKRFRELLVQAHTLSGEEQYELFADYLKKWKGGAFDQVDDILVMGFKI